MAGLEAPLRLAVSDVVVPPSAAVPLDLGLVAGTSFFTLNRDPIWGEGEFV